MTKNRPAINPDEIVDIERSVRLCAVRITRMVPMASLSPEDLEQDYYTWLLLHKKKHNPKYTFFRMVDYLRKYTHFNRKEKTTPINLINIDNDIENHMNPLMLQEDTSADMTQKWEEQSDTEDIIDQLDISSRNKRIMKLIFIDNLTQEEAANIIGVCNARISQLLKECKKEAKKYYLKGEHPCGLRH